ncbi:putative succinyl-CoA synthetase-like protein [metagenome]|uniref:Putative succinyl-CoA synthetase-like protein n=1 Tax=metagenome TaxID=256318 RepID=A0A2P2C5H2_9ZZZZ
MTPSADVLLTDGSVGVIRPLLPADGPALHTLHQEVSDENYRMRFFGLERRTGDQYVDHVLRDHTLALVLTLRGRIVALATAEPTPSGAAEVAFLVEDGHHGQGIGSLLLEHLAAAARLQSVDTFEAEVLADNYPMLAVFTDAGFTYQRGMSDGVATVRLDTRVTATSRAASDARDRRAEARSLHPLLYPRSVAVIGVRHDGTGIGHAVLDGIRRGRYTGDLRVIHPGDFRVEGVAVHPTFAAMPTPVDLAVIAVPATRVLAALSDAADAGVPCAVVISSGFQELGADGAVLQRELAVLARTRGIRVVGPNCLGVVSNGQDIRLNATFSPTVPPSGGLAVATQSGGVGIVMSDLARDLGLGIGSLVSLGNKADVSGNDLLAAWTDDPEVSAGAFYLESFGNAPKFARLARRFAERKPLLAVVGGRSAGGQRAGASHTAAAATTAVGVTALFAQAGVIGCDDAEDLAEAALMLTREPLPRGDRIAVVSNAGGMGVLAADVAAEHRLTLPELSAATRSRLAEHVSGTAGTSNPVDAGAGVDADAFAAIVEHVMTSAEVDAVLVVLVATSLADPGPTLLALAAVRERHPDLPLVLVTHGIERHDPSSLTRYRSTAGAIRAMGRAAGYAAWLGERTVETATDADQDRAISLAELGRRRLTAGRLLRGAADHGGWIGTGESGELLADYGLAPVGAVARGVEAVAELAASTGFPVAIKVADAAVVHRTDRGLVRVGLDSVHAVRAAVVSFARELGVHDVSVLVQPVVTGIEMAVGVVRDPTFGPLVMVGAGGVNTDVLLDRTYLLQPVHAADVRRALRGLRCWPLLEGFRGSAPVDVDALVEIVLAVAALAEDVAEVAEVDLNPVIVTPTGCNLIDVKLRLQEAVGATDGPRQLRPQQP